MSAKRIKELAVKVGVYTKDGKEKGRYKNVGVVLQGDDGKQYLMLDRTFNPAGVPNPDNKESVLVSMFDLKTDTGSTNEYTATTAALDKMKVDNDQVPF